MSDSHDNPNTAPHEVRGIHFYRLALGRKSFLPRYWVTWLGLVLLWCGAWLPLPFSRFLGSILGVVLYAANAKRRRIARINLALCFPEFTARERERLLKRHYRVSGQAYLDLGFLAWASEHRLRACVRINGLEHYEAELRRKRPVILLVPHSVGLNFGGAVISAFHPTVGMIKPLKNAVVNWLVDKGRTRFGCRLFLRSQGMRPVVRSLREGMTFYYLPDEDLGPEHSVFAPFFGVPAATLASLGRLAELSDAVVVPCFTRLLPGGGGYEVEFEAALAGFPSGDPLRDAARMNAVLEQGIRRMPEQYLWTFKIFKTRPGGAPSPYG